MREGKKNNTIEHNNALSMDTKLEQYIIRGVLGAGGFGITYLADDTNLDKQVVIKEFLPEEIAIRKDNITILPKTSRDDDSFIYGIEKFQEEAKTLAKFNHPNIVRILNFFRANGTAYLVMDFEEGEDLQEYIVSLRRDLTQKEILSIIIPILDGLREVHRHNFLHRDIKLSNIFIRKNSSPMLIDFGAARNAIGQKSKSITQILTPGYAPVEQYSTDISKQGAYTDIYAIGAVMYKMATGGIPKEAQDRSNALIDREADPYVSIKEKTKITIDESFTNAVDWALKIRAKDRPQSVKELQKALEGGNKEEIEIKLPTPKPIKIEKMQEVKKEEKPLKKSNLLPIIGSVAVVVSIVGLSYYYDTQEIKAIVSIERQNDPTQIKEENIFPLPQMVHISAGSFTMGSNNGYDDEKPPHKVNIDYDFEIGKYEVTIGEYKACVDDGGCKQPKRNDYYKKMCLKDNCPAIGVSWNNAKAYTQWLSKKTGKNYRLPMEAEWEFVARAGTTTKWSFGDNENDLKKYAWYDENSNDKTHQVGTKKANPWGVYDMHGNVCEWCEDWYLSNYNSTSRNGSTNHSKKDNNKVFRGGSWDGDANFIRSAIRVSYSPPSCHRDVGFRLQRTLS